LVHFVKNFFLKKKKKKKKKQNEINTPIVCEQYDIKPSRIGFANPRNFNLHFTMAQPIQLTAPNKTSYLQPTGG
jgi:hypothetical protein